MYFSSYARIPNLGAIVEFALYGNTQLVTDLASASVPLKAQAITQTVLSKLPDILPSTNVNCYVHWPNVDALHGMTHINPDILI